MDEHDSINALKERKLKILSQKHEQRKMQMEKRREVKTNQLADEENINIILEKFDGLEKSILSCFEQIENADVAKESLPELFDSCFCKLEEWQRMISLMSHVLKIYHKKRLQDKYHELNDRRAKLQQLLMPEKKFSFKKIMKKEVKNNGNDKDLSSKLLKDTVDSAIQKGAKKSWFKVEDEFGYFDRENENITLNHDEVLQKDFVFRDLKNCKLNIQGGATTIHFVALLNCHILCGPVSTSVFVENCHNCTFVVACQQLRIHCTYDTDFYIHVTSRAIIENSQRIRVAPYNWEYPNIKVHFETVGLDISQNNWNLINDFNWLSSSPSPNWSVINEADRVAQWN